MYSQGGGKDSAAGVTEANIPDHLPEPLHASMNKVLVDTWDSEDWNVAQPGDSDPDPRRVR